MKIILAKNYTVVPELKPRTIKHVVIHTMESPEKPGTAAAVAHWFAGPSAPKASAHYCIDADEVVQCVSERDIAWAAPGANSTGIQLEHAGRASQSDEAWQDDYSQRMLQLSAELVASICTKYDIPVVRLTPEELVAGKKGICGHDDVTRAFKKSTHTDPGPHFPWSEYLGRIFQYQKEREA